MAYKRMAKQMKIVNENNMRTNDKSITNGEYNPNLQTGYTGQINDIRLRIAFIF